MPMIMSTVVLEDSADDGVIHVSACCVKHLMQALEKLKVTPLSEVMPTAVYNTVEVELTRRLLGDSLTRAFYNSGSLTGKEGFSVKSNDEAAKRAIEIINQTPDADSGS